MKYMNLILVPAACLAACLISCEKPADSVDPAPQSQATSPAPEEAQARDEQRAARAAELMREGEAHAASGDMDNALACYREARRADPFDGRANRLLGEALYRHGELSDAAIYLKKSLQRAPELEGTRVLLGDVYAAGRIWQEAEGCYRSALTTNPADTLARHRLGLLLARRGRLEEAVEQFKAALEKGANAEVSSDLGLCYATMGRLDDAIGAYRDALAADAAAPETHARLGAAYMDAGRVNEAEAAFNEAARLDPNHAGARVGAGRVRLERGDAEQAADLLRQAIELDSRNADAHYHLGRALERLGRTDEAEAEYKLASSGEGGLLAASLALSELLVSQGNVEQAADYTYAAVKRDPESVAARLAHGNNLVRLRRGADAVKHFEKALELEPGLEEARRALDELQKASS